MPSPRYQEIADTLREKIEHGDLTPGEQLPTEKELANEYDTARNTIRDAIAQLKVLQLLETRPGKGTYVVEKPEVFRVTLTPEQKTGFSGGEGEAWIAEVSKVGRRATASKPNVEIKTGDRAKASALRVDSDESLIGRHQQRFITNSDGTPIPWSLQTSYYPFSFVERGATKLLRNEDIVEGTVAYLQATLGIKQASYRDGLSVRAPDKVETDFFNLPPGGGVQVFEHRRTTYDTDGTPCRHTITTYRTDRNIFVIEAEMPADDEG
ncbi:GntR family transcriptional regulator [Actinomadura rubrisoli]|uniref:GntR family transcriptional regulator n=1 Tax=Actinomadura rubrisoli TaxID=2530368 RepID=A0A4R5AX25_9ACTN|nr:GntR family transcriptional regulator [Actinomadura rubrisoli]TDD76720.1 GntR family transcriptional regulator [Actinomadura rubrisoli]